MRGIRVAVVFMAALAVSSCTPTTVVRSEKVEVTRLVTVAQPTCAPCPACPTPDSKILVVTATPPPASPTPEKRAVYGLGDSVTLDNLTITLNAVLSIEPTDFWKPDDGNKFIGLDVTLENVGATAVTVSSLVQMELVDSSGFTYDVDMMAELAADVSGPDGEIAAGTKKRGIVGFQVPIGATGLVFQFDPSLFFAGDTIRFVLP